MSHRCNRNFWDRREFLFRVRRRHQRTGAGVSARPRRPAGGGAGGAATPARQPPSASIPYAPKPPHFKPRATAVISLFMGGGWSQVDTFDPKPALDEIRRPADRRQSEGRRHRAAGLPGPADAEPVHVQEVRAERHRGLGDLPAPQPARRRDRVPALGLRPIERPRAGHLRDADRADQPRVSQRRLVGHLRPRLGGVEPAGVRRDDRRARRTARRTERLERRLHAGRLPGHAVPLDGRSDCRSQAAGRADAPTISARGSTRWRS